MATTDLSTDRREDRFIELEQAASRWAARRLAVVAGGIEHERRVLAIAVKLFDLTRPLLNLSSAHARTLRLAALLHDVGRAIDERDHPRQGANLILTTTAIPLSPAERRALAFLTRYHRGAVPPLGKEEHLTSADDRPALHKLLALLRVADALDNRQLPPLELTFSLEARLLTIDATVTSNFRRAREVFTRRKKFRMLEDLMDGSITMNLARATADSAA